MAQDRPLGGVLCRRRPPPDAPGGPAVIYGCYADDDHSPEAEAYRAMISKVKADQREAFDRLRSKHRPSFNVRPTMTAPILTSTGAETARWGWERSFATSGRIINARWETATEKPTFRAEVEASRCVVLAVAYYEWQRDANDRPIKGGKHAFRAANGDWLAMAGVWEQVGDEARFLIFTRAMVLHVDIHDRTPVMLTPDAVEAWLDPAAPIGDVLDAARCLGDDYLRPYRVCDVPTKARPAGPHLSEPVTDGQARIF
jgi:putative SOS response-associated peptidase YedK